MSQMGIFSGIIGLPLAPVRGVMALSEVIARQVEQERNNPATTRRQLEELEEARERGEISAEEEREAQEEILETRLSTAPSAPTPENG
jgi:cytochrome c-type biogenesis protein CcmH/NrfG